MRKVLLFVIVALAFVGVVSGIGYAVYYGNWFVAVCIAILGWLAYYTAKDIIKRIMA